MRRFLPIIPWVLLVLTLAACSGTAGQPQTLQPDAPTSSAMAQSAPQPLLSEPVMQQACLGQLCAWFPTDGTAQEQSAVRTDLASSIYVGSSGQVCPSGTSDPRCNGFDWQRYGVVLLTDHSPDAQSALATQRQHMLDDTNVYYTDIHDGWLGGQPALFAIMGGITNYAFVWYRGATYQIVTGGGSGLATYTQQLLGSVHFRSS